MAGGGCHRCRDTDRPTCPREKWHRQVRAPSAGHYKVHFPDRHHRFPRSHHRLSGRHHGFPRRHHRFSSHHRFPRSHHKFPSGRHEFPSRHHELRDSGADRHESREYVHMIIGSRWHG
jgi:hypothetical protein